MKYAINHKKTYTILSIVLLSLFLLSGSDYVFQNAYAATDFILDLAHLDGPGTGCEALGGVWVDGTKTCTVTGNLILSTVDTITIDNGVTFVVSGSPTGVNADIVFSIQGAVTNNGTILMDNTGTGTTSSDITLIVGIGGSLLNNGTLDIDHNGDAPGGAVRTRILSNGPITNNGSILLDNHGAGLSVNTLFDIVQNTVTNNGSISLDINGISSGFGSVFSQITVVSTLNNSGDITVDNHGISANNSQSGVTNAASGTIDDLCGSTLTITNNATAPNVAEAFFNRGIINEAGTYTGPAITNIDAGVVNDTSATCNAPVVTISSPADGAFIETDPFTISGTVTDADSDIVSVQVSIDGGAFGAVGSSTLGAGGAWSTSSGTLSDATHTIEIKATDGNTNEGTASITIGVDDTDPTKTIGPATAGGKDLTDPPVITNSGEFSITFGFNDNSLTYASPGTLTKTCSLEDAGGDVGNSPLANCNGTTTLTEDDFLASPGSLPEGVYTFTANAVDEAGNDPAATVTWTVDTTPPQVTSATIIDSNTIQVKFDEPVNTVLGDYTPTIDTVARTPASLTGSGSDTINFDFTAVLAADNTEAIGTMAIAATVIDIAGNNLVAVPAQPLLDGQVPIVLTAGTEIVDNNTMNVKYSENVVSTVQTDYTITSITGGAGGETLDGGSLSGTGTDTISFDFTTVLDADNTEATAVIVIAAGNIVDTSPQANALVAVPAQAVGDGQPANAAITHDDSDGFVKNGDSVVFTATYTEELDTASTTPSIRIIEPALTSTVETVVTPNAACTVVSGETVCEFNHNMAGDGDGVVSVKLKAAEDIPGNLVTNPTTPNSVQNLVLDNTAPTLTLPTTETGSQFLNAIEATSAAGDTLVFEVSASDLNGVKRVTCVSVGETDEVTGAIASPKKLTTPTKTFPIAPEFTSHTEEVDCEAEDRVGNVNNIPAETDFDITVVDTTDPTMEAPAGVLADTSIFSCDESPSECSTVDGTDTDDLEVGSFLYKIEATGPTGTVVNFEITSGDIVGTSSIVCAVTGSSIESLKEQTVSVEGPTSLTLDNGDDDTSEGEGVLLNPPNPTGIKGQLLGISDRIFQIHLMVCTALDTAGNSFVVTLDLKVEDTTAPIPFAPIDTDPVDAKGVHTPIDIELGTEGGGGAAAPEGAFVDPEGAFVADLVSTGDVITTGMPVGGQILLVNDRPATDDKCDDGVPVPPFDKDPGEVSCFLETDATDPSTTITYTATDTAGNVADDEQLVVVNPTPIEMGWEREVSGVVKDVFVLVETIETQIEGEEYIQLTDYRSNLDNSKKDTLTISLISTSDNGITVTLKEDEKNSGNFTHNKSIKFTATGTDDSKDKLLVADEDLVEATYDSPAASPTNPASGLADSKTITSTIFDFRVDKALALGATVSGDFPMVTDSDVYIVETSGTVVVFDPELKDNGSTKDVVKGKLRMVSAAFLGEDIGAGIGIKLKEKGDTGILTGTLQFTVTEGASDKKNKVIKVVPGEPVTFTYVNGGTVYDVGSGDEVIVDIIPNPIDNTQLTKIGADFNLRLTCLEGDTDGDAICDEWETEDGLLITFTDDDDVTTQWFEACDKDIPNDCPDPRRKDLYVEIDYMSYHKPDADAIADVVAAFDNAPLENPGGSDTSEPTGVNLHVLVDDDIGDHVVLMPFETTGGILGFHDRKEIFFGTVDERTAGTCVLCIGTPEEIATLKRQVYHWSLWIHDQADCIGCSGTGEVGGNDFLVSLGSFAQGKGTVEDQATTFMHEFGHNLALNHGGGAGATYNCKPNLFSIMNYAYQFTDFVSDRPLDFSRVQAATLDSRALVEADGISEIIHPGVGGSPAFTLTAVFGGDDGVARTSLTGIGIDWDKDGSVDPDTDNTVKVKISKLDIPGCSGNDALRKMKAGAQWPLARFDFRTTDVFADGSSQLKDSLFTEDGILLFRGVDEPLPATFAALLSSNLDILDEAIGALIAPGDCAETDIDALEAKLEAIRAIFTSDDERRTQLLDAIIALEALKDSPELLACFGGALDDEIEALQSVYLDASNGSVELFDEHPPKLDKITGEPERASIEADTDDLFHLIIRGTPEFDTSLIDPSSLVFGPEDKDARKTIFAKEAHLGDIPFDLNVNHPHNSDFDTADGALLEDLIDDLEGHFFMNEITTPLLNDIDTDGDGIFDAHNVCVTGIVIIGGGELPFSGCLVLTVSGPVLVEGFALSNDGGATIDENPDAFTTAGNKLTVIIASTTMDFGDLKKLEAELKDSDKNKIKVTILDFTTMVTGPVGGSATATMTGLLDTFIDGEIVEFKIKAEDNNRVKSEFKIPVTIGGAPAGAPTADAGPDQTVDERVSIPGPSTVVTLDGSGSSSDDPITFKWTQTGGVPVVVLSPDDTAEMPTFDAPAVPDGTSVTLTFELEVTDSVSTLIDLDTVDVTVKDIDAPAPLEGFSLSSGANFEENPAAFMTDGDDLTVTIADSSVDFGSLKKLEAELKDSDKNKIKVTILDFVIAGDGLSATATMSGLTSTFTAGEIVDFKIKVEDTSKNKSEFKIKITIG